MPGGRVAGRQGCRNAGKAWMPGCREARMPSGGREAGRPRMPGCREAEHADHAEEAGRLGGRGCRDAEDACRMPGCRGCREAGIPTMPGRPGWRGCREDGRPRMPSMPRRPGYPGCRGCRDAGRRRMPGPRGSAAPKFGIAGFGHNGDGPSCDGERHMRRRTPNGEMHHATAIPRRNGDGPSCMSDGVCTGWAFGVVCRAPLLRASVHLPQLKFTYMVAKATCMSDKPTCISGKYVHVQVSRVDPNRRNIFLQ
jgi:hypothetical protein